MKAGRALPPASKALTAGENEIGIAKPLYAAVYSVAFVVVNTSTSATTLPTTCTRLVGNSCIVAKVTETARA